MSFLSKLHLRILRFSSPSPSKKERTGLSPRSTIYAASFAGRIPLPCNLGGLAGRRLD